MPFTKGEIYEFSQKIQISRWDRKNFKNEHFLKIFKTRTTLGVVWKVLFRNLIFDLRFVRYGASSISPYRQYSCWGLKGVSQNPKGSWRMWDEKYFFTKNPSRTQNESFGRPDSQFFDFLASWEIITKKSSDRNFFYFTAKIMLL